MIPQADLAAYWQEPKRHGFKKPRFDVRVNEYHRRSGKFTGVHMVYVCAWTHEDAKAVALRQLRAIPTREPLGALQAVEVTYSQPVSWGVKGAAA